MFRHLAKLSACVWLIQTAHAQVEAPFGIEELSQLAQTPNVNSVADLVPLLPQKFLTNFTLIADSNSLQKSDPTSPRAIAWDEKNKMVITWNSHSPHLEILKIDSNSNAAHFYELSFPSKKISEPASCKTCHGQAARPIWQEYPVWPNSFGNHDDFPDDERETQFSHFIESLADPAQKIYTPLFPPPESPLNRYNYPFRPYYRFNSNDLSTGFAYRPNLRLGAFLTRLNARQILERITKHPQYQSNRDGLIYALMNCESDPQMKSAISLLTLFDLSASDFDLRNTRNDPENAKLDFKLSYFDGASTTTEYLIAGLLSDWTKSDPSHSKMYAARGLMDKYSATTPRNMIDYPFFTEMDQLSLWFPLPYDRTNFTQKIQKREPYLMSYQQQYLNVCAELKKNQPVDSALIPTAVTPTIAGENIPRGLEVMQKHCAECHSAEARETFGDHQLTFLDPADLKSILAKNKNRFIKEIKRRTLESTNIEDRMPLYRDPLSSEDRTAVLEYIQSIP